MQLPSFMAHRRQFGIFNLELLFVSPVRLGAVVTDLGFFVKVEVI